MRKTYDFPNKVDITVTCASGIEKPLKSELVRLGFPDLPAINGAITFSGNAVDLARCNINLRTADRVYLKVCEFQAQSFDELFEGVKSAEWERFLPSNARVIVNGKCVRSKIFAISASQSIVKKAIAVRLCERYGLTSLPETGNVYGVHFSIFKDTVCMLINTSGAGLHKRGYRDLVGIAPIKETLASGLTLLSDFYWKNPFADPFCGSGTIAIETAMIALNIAPCKNRAFDYNGWSNYDRSLHALALEEALDKEQLDKKIEFFASDIDPKAIKLAKRHAERAGVKDRINFCVRGVKNFTSDLPNGTIVTNPPYGERVYDMREAENCYKDLRTAFDGLNNWSLHAITSAKFFQRAFGKQADKERKIFNSNTECRYYCYRKKEKR